MFKSNHIKSQYEASVVIHYFLGGSENQNIFSWQNNQMVKKKGYDLLVLRSDFSYLGKLYLNMAFKGASKSTNYSITEI